MGYSDAKYEKAKVAFGDITGSFVSFLTLSHSGQGLVILNTLDAAVEISLPPDSDTNTTTFWLEAGEPLVVTFEAMGRQIEAGAFKIKYTSGAPTSGSLRVTVIR